MNRNLPILRSIVIITITVLVSQCSADRSLPTRKSPESKWEKIFFKDIDVVTKLANITPLREVLIKHDDIEVRVWRGSGIGTFEGVIISRKDGIWRANHLIGRQGRDLDGVKVRDVVAQHGKWEDFWQRVVDAGLLNLQEGSGEACNSSLDGTSYVVEISRQGIYETNMHASDVPNCPGSKEMDKIGAIIADEFHNGSGECSSDEWLACAELVKRPKP